MRASCGEGVAAAGVDVAFLTAVVLPIPMDAAAVRGVLV